MKPRTASLLLFAAAAASACLLKLGPAVLAGLFAFMILDLTYRRLRAGLPETGARWLSAGIFLVLAAALGFLFFKFVRLTLLRIPAMAASMMPAISQLNAEYGLGLPFANIEELRAVVLEAVVENARSIRAGSGLLTHGFFQALLGALSAVFLFLPSKNEAAGDSLLDVLGAELSQRARLFADSFEKVLGAQALLALVNAVVVAAFVAATDVPYLYFLTLSSFILGMIPIVGNIVAAALIVGAALTQSVDHGAAALVFILVWHKVLLVLSGRVVGGRLKTSTWATLLGIVAGEVVLGVPGIILAPALLHYAREELAALPGRKAL
jgi:predicted PurR-regulated permease PerM